MPDGQQWTIFMTWVFWIICRPEFFKFNLNIGNKHHGLCYMTMQAAHKSQIALLFVANFLAKKYWSSQASTISTQFDFMQLLAIPKTKTGDKRKSFEMISEIIKPSTVILEIIPKNEFLECFKKIYNHPVLY